jgi:hypothetical protein
MKNAIACDVWWFVLVRTGISEEHIASIIRVTRIGELGTTLSVNSNSSKRRFIQEPHGVISQTTAFFRQRISS